MELRGWGNAKIFVREFLSLIHVKVDMYFTAAGLFYIPAEQRLIDTMQILKQKNAEKSAEIKELWCNPMTGITP